MTLEDRKISAKQFIDTVINIGKVLGFSISHEDCHGAFIIENYNEHRAEWLRSAFIDLEPPAPYMTTAERLMKNKQGDCEQGRFPYPVEEDEKGIRRTDDKR